MEFYQYTAKSIRGEDIEMSQYMGKSVLVVNTASKCGFTPQLEGLEKLYQAHKDKGFVVLGFPCNQFLNQEPGDELSIEQGCVLNYGVTFPMFSKVNVNGDNAHPIFKYLRKELSGILGSAIEWNFTKFLIDPQGKPIKRFPPITTPLEIDKYLKKVLKS